MSTWKGRDRAAGYIEDTSKLAALPDNQKALAVMPEDGGMFFNETAKEGKWIGVDLDGTLAKHDGKLGEIGSAIPSMVERVEKWIDDGHEVRIFTARAESALERIKVKKWLSDNDLPDLAITNKKDWKMLELYDDRAIRVEHNKGTICPSCQKAAKFNSLHLAEY